MAKEVSAGFLENFGSLVTQDHASRWKAIYWIIGVTAVLGILDLNIVKDSVEDATFLMGAIMLLMSVGWVAVYCSFRRHKPTASSAISNRALMVQGFLFLVVIVVSLSLLRVQVSTVERRLVRASQYPESSESMAMAKQTLTAAREGFIRIRSSVVTQTGTRFLQDAEERPKAWDVVGAFLDYRSFLNLDILPKAVRSIVQSTRPTPATGLSSYRSSLTILPNPEHPEWHKAAQVTFAGGYAPPEKAARLERLDHPQSEGSEFAFFVVDGGLDTLVLDDMFMKHVIVRNADIQYDGGHVHLQDVYFVNCTFRGRFKLTPRAVKISYTMLVEGTIPLISDSQQAFESASR